jgi:hypothetical protein
VALGEFARAGSVLDDYQSEEELATDLDVCVKTLRRWHAARRGPPRVAVGRRKKYRRAAVAEWLIKREQGFDDDEKRPRGQALRR